MDYILLNNEILLRNKFKNNKNVTVFWWIFAKNFWILRHVLDTSSLFIFKTKNRQVDWISILNFNLNFTCFVKKIKKNIKIYITLHWENKVFTVKRLGFQLIVIKFSNIISNSDRQNVNRIVENRRTVIYIFFTYCDCNLIIVYLFIH